MCPPPSGQTSCDLRRAFGQRWNIWVTARWNQRIHCPGCMAVVLPIRRDKRINGNGGNVNGAGRFLTRVMRDGTVLVVAVFQGRHLNAGRCGHIRPSRRSAAYTAIATCKGAGRAGAPLSLFRQHTS
jgi:hypothetical protein